MSTPGRKRVQPILIEDDDDNESSSSETLIASSSSASSNTIVADITPSLPIPTTESSASLLEIKQSIKKNLYVALNFDELSHIRNVQTNSEFATLLYDFQLYKNVVNGHICFSCRKVKFSLLQSGIRCPICLQRTCSKCQRKMSYRQDNICFVSLNLLRRSSTLPTTSFTNDMTTRRNERTDSESSSSSSSTINKYPKLHKKKLSNNSFSCCIDCFILFDPASLV